MRVGGRACTPRREERACCASGGGSGRGTRRRRGRRGRRGRSIPMSVLLTWIYYSTGGSLLIVVLLHATANLPITVLLAPLGSDMNPAVLDLHRAADHRRCRCRRVCWPSRSLAQAAQANIGRYLNGPDSDPGVLTSDPTIARQRLDRLPFVEQGCKERSIRRPGSLCERVATQ